MLNTELKILAKVLLNWLQVVISELIEPKQNYAVKRRSIQNNLHLIHTILDGGKEDDTETALINLDQSKAFDKVDHHFLVSVLNAAGYQPSFHKWISILYRALTAVVQVNEKHSKSFTISRSMHQGSPLLYVLALELLFHKLGSLVLYGITLPDGSRARVSTFANDITIFVSRF